MIVSSSKRTVSPQAAGAAASARPAMRSSLSMYNEQPTEELTLEDFEVFAFERLKSECPHEETGALAHADGVSVPWHWQCCG